MFTLHDIFKDPKRTVTRPPYNIQEAGYGSFKILIYTFSARVEYDLDRLYDLAPFKQPNERDFQKRINTPRVERIRLPTRYEVFKRRLMRA